MSLISVLYSHYFFVENGKKQFKRSCYIENVDAPKDDCVAKKTPSNIENHFCETCQTDGCNLIFYSPSHNFID